MSRFTRFITGVLACALILTTPVFGQTTQQADASVSIVVAPFLTLQKTLDIDFGTHFAAEGSLFTTLTNYAQWRGNSDVGNRLSVHLDIPGALNKVGSPGSVPFQCNDASAKITNDVVVQRFNPATGIASFGPIAAPGTITLEVGNPAGTPGDDHYLCVVNIANAQRGTYQGFITAVLTVL